MNGKMGVVEIWIELWKMVRIVMRFISTGGGGIVQLMLGNMKSHVNSLDMLEERSSFILILENKGIFHTSNYYLKPRTVREIIDVFALLCYVLTPWIHALYWATAVFSCWMYKCLCTCMTTTTYFFQDLRCQIANKKGKKGGCKSNYNVAHFRVLFMPAEWTKTLFKHYTGCIIMNSLPRV